MIPKIIQETHREREINGQGRRHSRKARRASEYTDVLDRVPNSPTMVMNRPETAVVPNGEKLEQHKIANVDLSTTHLRPRGEQFDTRIEDLADAGVLGRDEMRAGRCGREVFERYEVRITLSEARPNSVGDFDHLRVQGTNSNRRNGAAIIRLSLKSRDNADRPARSREPPVHVERGRGRRPGRGQREDHHVLVVIHALCDDRHESDQSREASEGERPRVRIAIILESLNTRIQSIVVENPSSGPRFTDGSLHDANDL